jgi:hypothetical protein
MFIGGLNNWKIVSLTAKDGCDSNEGDLADAAVLENIMTIMAENIEVGKIDAFCTKHKEADGYFVVIFTTDPYTLQEAILLTEYEPPLELNEGELMCKAKHYMKIP